MIDSSDLIRIPYTGDLTEAGIAYVLRSLPFTFDRSGGSPYPALRRTVVHVAVELALRRYLSGRGIPFEVQAPTPFTAPDRYDVSLGGHRCDLQCFLVSQREKISLLHREPRVLLSAPALVASDGPADNVRSGHDLYLFAFVTGLIAASAAALKKATETGQPYYLIHVMDAQWRRPPSWKPLGPLALTSASDGELLIEISGQGEGREYLSRTLRLPPKSRAAADDPFYSVTAVHAASFPNAHLEIVSATRNETHIIRQTEWGNIWVYGMEIYLTGYISRQAFHQRARAIVPNSRVLQDVPKNGKSLAVDVSELNPLGSLFEDVRAWDRNQAR